MGKIGAFIFDVFIAILIIFLSVTVYYGLRTETVLKTLDENVTDDFMEKVKTDGNFTTREYETLLNRLSLTKEIYDITFEHRYSIFEPEYRFRTVQEIIDAQNAAYTGTNIYHYKDVLTQKPRVSDPVNNSSLNTETNESILAAAVNLPASVGHVHSDACYLGTKHVHTNGCYSSVPSTTYCNGIIHGTWTTYYNFVDRTCSYCGTSFGSMYNVPNTSTQTQKCYSCGETCTFTGTFTFQSWLGTCSKCGDGFTDPGREGAEHGTIITTTIKLTCGKITGCYYDSTGILCSPVCNQIITNIAPTNPTQTIAAGDELITTVLADYLDESEKTVVATTNFSTASICQNQSVTLTYNYTISGKAYSKTCSITVTVIQRTKICINGHSYNLNPDGSDLGCPYCKAWVKSIRFLYPTSQSMTITIGTTLQQNGVKLLVTYLDGHSEIITDGYEDNLDTTYLGTKPVTIGYKGETAPQLWVTTACKKVKCGICGNYYDLYPDGSDPGCPYCITKTPVFTGKVLKYQEANYTENILDALYKNGKYEFHKNDTFIITVKNKSENMAHKITGKLFPSLSDTWINIRKTVKIRTN